MSELSKLAIYPGSFDPVTNGHIDIIQRSLKLFDQVIILIATSSQKTGFFSLDEKKELLNSVFGQEKRVIIDSSSGLLMDYAKEKKASAIIRGLRAVSDFEYEFQMASMNKRLYGEIDTVFMMTSEKYFFISSQLVKEVARLGGSLDKIVPPTIEKKLREKLGL